MGHLGSLLCLSFHIYKKGIILLYLGALVRNVYGFGGGGLMAFTHAMQLWVLAASHLPLPFLMSGNVTAFLKQLGQQTIPGTSAGICYSTQASYFMSPSMGDVGYLVHTLIGQRGACLHAIK